MHVIMPVHSEGTHGCHKLVCICGDVLLVFVHKLNCTLPLLGVSVHTPFFLHLQAPANSWHAPRPLNSKKINTTCQASQIWNFHNTTRHLNFVEGDSKVRELVNTTRSCWKSRKLMCMTQKSIQNYGSKQIVTTLLTSLIVFAHKQLGTSPDVHRFWSS